MNTATIAGLKFNIVNELPAEVQEKLTEVVTHGVESDYSPAVIESIIEYLDGGACGKVYHLSDDLILKVNSFSWKDTTYDGDILNDLQGVPFIPKLYWYSEDNRFIVIQKIKGLTSQQYGRKPFKIEGWNQEEHEAIATKAEMMCTERGWIMNDLHNQNVMIDFEGRFWVIDVGLFQKVEKLSERMAKRLQVGSREELIEEGKYILKVQSRENLMAIA